MALNAWMLLLGALIQDGLRDLDSPDPAVARRAMEEAIRAVDDKALEAAAKTSPGACLALAEVRAHRRFGDAYPPVPSFTYEASDQPAEEVIEKLSGLLGIRIVPREKDALPPNWKTRLYITLKNATFLEAIDKLSSSMNAHLMLGPDSIEYGRIPALVETKVYWRHFKMALDSLQVSAHVIGPEGKKEEASLRLLVTTDRQCRIVGHRSIRFTVATDEAGLSLVPGGVDADPVYDHWHRFKTIGLSGPLIPPSVDCKKLAIVRGVVRLLLPEGPVTKEISLTKPGLPLELTNLSVQIQNASADASEIRVSATIGDLKKPHVRPTLSDFQLIGKDGRLVPAQGSMQDDLDRVLLDLKFRLPEGFVAASLSVRTFRTVGEHEVPFEFRDIHLQ